MPFQIVSNCSRNLDFTSCKMRFVTNDSAATQGRSTENQYTKRSWLKEQSYSSLIQEAYIKPSIEKAKPWRNSSPQLLWKVINTWPSAHLQSLQRSLPPQFYVMHSGLKTIYTLSCYCTCHLGVVRNSHAADVVVGSSRHLSRTPCPMAAKGKMETSHEPQLMHVLNWAGSLQSCFGLTVLQRRNVPRQTIECCTWIHGWAHSFLKQEINQPPFHSVNNACSKVNIYTYSSFSFKVIQTFFFL